MTEERLERQVERVLESVRREFADDVPTEVVTAIGAAHFDRLRANARITEFIPVLVYRSVREEVLRIRRDELHQAV